MRLPNLSPRRHYPLEAKRNVWQVSSQMGLLVESWGGHQCAWHPSQRVLQASNVWLILRTNQSWPKRQIFIGTQHSKWASWFCKIASPWLAMLLADRVFSSWWCQYHADRAISSKKNFSSFSDNRGRKNERWNKSKFSYSSSRKQMKRGM